MTTYKAKRPKNKSKKQQLLAHRYKCAYNYLFEKLPSWKKSVMIEKHDSQEERVVKEFTHEVAKLAESNREIPDMSND
tara:strand:- start:2625 stop:2858 length:234 start_codon:yes stop_codon:yes gene_type:complete